MKLEDKNRIFDDAAKLISGGLELASGVSREASALVRAKVQKFVRDFNLTDAETHEITTAMAVKAREENQALAKKIEALEERIAALESVSKE